MITTTTVPSAQGRPMSPRLQDGLPSSTLSARAPEFRPNAVVVPPRASIPDLPPYPLSTPLIKYSDRHGNMYHGVMPAAAYLPPCVALPIMVRATGQGGKECNYVDTINRDGVVHEIQMFPASSPLSCVINENESPRPFALPSPEFPFLEPDWMYYNDRRRSGSPTRSDSDEKDGQVEVNTTVDKQATAGKLQSTEELKSTETMLQGQNGDHAGTRHRALDMPPEELLTRDLLRQLDPTDVPGNMLFPPSLARTRLAARISFGGPVGGEGAAAKAAWEQERSHLSRDKLRCRARPVQS